MVYVDPEFEVPAVPDYDKYEGTELDQNIQEGEASASRLFACHRKECPSN